MKKSIRGKINILVIISLVALSFFMVLVNLVIINIYTNRSSEIMLEKTCSSKTLELNNQLEKVEQAVNNIYFVSEQVRPELDKLKNEKVAEEYVEAFRDIAITIADNTDGAMAIYYRVNPDITGSGTTGFFYVKSAQTGKFESETITDLYDYSVDDVEHVGWYYVPVWEGKPVWMDPYYNANIDTEMISYVVPIYDGNALVGVVGMDMDFNSIEASAEDIDVYKSSGAILCSLSNSKAYYDKCDIFGDTVPSDIYNVMQGNDVSDETFVYKIKGKKYECSYHTLQNRMKLLVYAEASEINSQRKSSILVSVLIFVVIFIVTLVIAMRVSKRITMPITEITAAAKQYAEGRWDIKVHCDTNDELQELTENISIMASNTKDYIDCINDMANKDALTGIRNKAAYMVYVDVLINVAIPTDKQFSIVVFDLNNLKKVNDSLGHEKGDDLLVSASRMICKYFEHSPIFRVGGDEFVAIVDAGDYENRYELLEDFKKYMRLSSNSNNIMDVCIACGMADFDADGETFEEVFDKADQRMYENKAELKNGDEIR